MQPPPFLNILLSPLSIRTTPTMNLLNIYQSIPQSSRRIEHFVYNAMLSFSPPPLSIPTRSISVAMRYRRQVHVCTIPSSARREEKALAGRFLQLRSDQRILERSWVGHGGFTTTKSTWFANKTTTTTSSTASSFCYY